MLLELYLLLLVLAVVMTFGFIACEFAIRKTDHEDPASGLIKHRYSGPKYFSVMLCIFTWILWFAVAASSVNVEVYQVAPLASSAHDVGSHNTTYTNETWTFTYSWVANSQLYYTSEMFGLFMLGSALGLVFLVLSIYMIVDVRRSI